MKRLVALAIAAAIAAPAAAAPPKRPVPVYDDRGPAPATAGDVALWIPRVLLFPARVVVDYGVRTPFGWLTRAIERSRTGRAVFRYLFLLPPTPTPSIYPVALYDFGMKPSVGVRLLWQYGFLTPGSKLSIKLGTGGLDWWRVDAGVRYQMGRAFTSIDAGARRQPDYRFYGIGSHTPEEAAARYGARRIGGALRAGVQVAPWAEASAATAVATTAFRADSYAGDPSIERRVSQGRIAALPEGYEDGYATARVGGRVILDSREGARSKKSGARLDTELDRVWASDDREPWTRFELRAGAELLLDEVAERQLDVRFEAQLVEGARIPFLELTSVAGSSQLRGFPSGRLFDASAASLVVEYQWPLAAWLDARAHVGAGNVFGPRWSGMTAGAMRGSAGLALLLAGLSQDRQIALSTAVGTDPFDQGFEVSSFRIVFGFLYDY